MCNVEEVNGAARTYYGEHTKIVGFILKVSEHAVCMLELRSFRLDPSLINGGVLVVEEYVVATFNPKLLKSGKLNPKFQGSVKTLGFTCEHIYKNKASAFSDFLKRID